MGTCPVGSPGGQQEPIYEWDYYDINVSVGGGQFNGNASTAYIVSPGGAYCPPNGPTGTLNINVTGAAGTYTNYLVSVVAETNGQIYVVIQGTEEFFPTYKVVSLLYPPPGNQSSQSYVTGTTTGTTTTIGQSLADTVTLTATAGTGSTGISLGGTIGYTTTESFSQALSQTWTGATGYATQANTETAYNPTLSNMIDHNWDQFLIWLNPEVIVSGTTEAADWTLAPAPITGLSSNEAVIVNIPAQLMEANTAGVSTVPVQQLDPQEVGDGEAFLPGLASFCKNQSYYQEQLAYDIANPSKANGANGGTQYCTQANQCGCTPADFLPILQKDVLLNINPKTYKPYTTTPTGYSGSTDPRTLDGAGVSICSENPVPKGSDCRYVAITYPAFEMLESSAPLSYTQTDQETSSFTQGASYGEITGFTITVGSPFFKLQYTNTWTWTDSESTQDSNGTSNSMQLNLKTSSLDCSEPVTIFEDTLYHTFVFQVPEDWQSVCP